MTFYELFAGISLSEQVRQEIIDRLEPAFKDKMLQSQLTNEDALREALYKLARTPYKFGSMRSDETIIERALAVADNLEKQRRGQQRRAQAQTRKRLDCCGTLVPRPGVTHKCSTTQRK